MENVETTIREIRKEEYTVIAGQISEIYFLPKITWKTTLSNMALSGLTCGRWTGVGLFNANGQLMAYLDYKIKEDSIEIGICYTLEKYRNNHMMSKLLSCVMAKYPGTRFEMGTYEANTPMRKCCEGLGFTETHRKKDRIDGTDSVYYEYRPAGNKI